MELEGCAQKRDVGGSFVLPISRNILGLCWHNGSLDVLLNHRLKT